MTFNNPTTVSIDGKALKLTDEPLVNGWKCYENQKNARMCFNREGQYSDLGDSYYMLNHAPTGGGKTFSWEDPVIRNRMDAIVMYPTNALIQDQSQSIQTHIEEFYDADDDVGTLTITASELSRKQRERDGTYGGSGDLIEVLIREKKREYENLIVFTNPDIFVNVRCNEYDNTMAKRMTDLFELVVVDEFHVANMKQKSILLDLMEQMRDDPNSETRLCMLLSATPDRHAIRRIENTGAEVVDLNESTATRPHSEVVDNDQYRTVMPPVDLEVRPGQTFQVGDSLMGEQWWHNTVEFCKDASRTVMMLDSQKEVSQLSRALDREIPEVLQIDGQTGGNLRSRVERFNQNTEQPMTLVSNSAVEVGIDFSCDQILFSGMSYDRTLQRLGRLRNREDTVSAVGYVPSDTINEIRSLKQENEEPITRQTLRNGIKTTFLSSRSPQSYPATFGAHGAYEQVKRTAQRSPSDERQKILERGRERIQSQQLAPFGVDTDWSEFERTHDELEDVMDVIMDYRSGEPSTLVFKPGNNSVQTQEINRVLRTGDIDICSRDKFFAIIHEEVDNPETCARLRDEIGRKENYSHGYVVLHGNEYAEKSNKNHNNVKPRQISVNTQDELRALLATNEAERVPQKLSKYELVVDSGDLSPVNVAPLNEALSEANPLVYPINMPSYEARYELYLDSYFFLTDIAFYRTDDAQASIAVGENALYLFCLIQERLYRQNPDRTDLKIDIPDTVWDF